MNPEITADNSAALSNEKSELQEENLTSNPEVPAAEIAEPDVQMTQEPVLQEEEIAERTPVSEVSDAPMEESHKEVEKTAEEVVNTYSGYFPESESELLKLSGVGKYTARAIMVFANRAQVSMIDTNIRQIIVHYFFNGFPQKEKAVEAVADQLVPRDKSWEWHQALMDYGALELKNVIDTTKKVKKSVAVPFKESNRYFRGRVIDALRQKSWEEKKLIAYTSDYYKKSPSFVKKIIDGLLKDGLLERSKKLLQLPLS